MSEELLASGGVVNAADIVSSLGGVPDNNRVRLQFDLTVSPAGWMVSAVKSGLGYLGLEGLKVTSNSPDMSISWIHHPDTISDEISYAALVWVVAGIIAVVVAIVVIIGWSMWRDIPSPLKGPLLTALVAGAIILGVSIAWRNFRQKY